MGSLDEVSSGVLQVDPHHFKKKTHEIDATGFNVNITPINTWTTVVSHTVNANRKGRVLDVLCSADNNGRFRIQVDGNNKLAWFYIAKRLDHIPFTENDG